MIITVRLPGNIDTGFIIGKPTRSNNGKEIGRIVEARLEGKYVVAKVKVTDMEEYEKFRKFLETKGKK